MRKRILMLAFAVLLSLVLLCVLAACAPDGEEPSASVSPAVVEREGVYYRPVRDDTAFEVQAVTAAADAELVVASTVNGLPVVGIAENAFESGYRPVSVVLPDTTEYIGYNAVLKNAEFASLNDGLYYIGSERNPNLAIVGCERGAGVQCVTLAENTQTVMECALSDCLTASFAVTGDNARYKSEEGILYSADGTVLVRYPTLKEDAEFVVPATVSSMAEYAFSGNGFLQEVTLSDGLCGVNDKTFFNCTALSSVSLPDGVTSIGEYAFSNCLALTSVFIPDSVTTIGYCAFGGSGLTAVDIPDSVNEMGSRAFDGCINLTSVKLSEGLTFVAPFAFNYCYGLKSIAIPDSVAAIYGCAFRHCVSLEEIELGNGVAQIADNVFEGCTSLTSIALCGNVKTVGNRAFENCTSLAEIVIGVGVATIGDGAFSGCAPQNVVVEDGNLGFEVREDGLYSADGRLVCGIA